MSDLEGHWDTSGWRRIVGAAAAAGAGWLGTMKGIFAAATGLGDLQWQALASCSELEDFNARNGYWQNDVVTSGAGASADPSTDAGSVLSLIGPNAATAGFARWFPGALIGDGIPSIGDQLWSVRQRRWMVPFRVGVSQSLANGNPFVLGLASVDVGGDVVHKLGIGSPNLVLTPNWWITIDDVAIFDTGVPITTGSTGRDYLIDLYLACFDFEHLVVNFHPGVAPDIVCGTMDMLNPYTNDMSARPYVGIESAGGNLVHQALFIDKATLIGEL